MCVICYKCTQQCAHTLSQRSVKSWASFVTSIFYQVTPSFHRSLPGLRGSPCRFSPAAPHPPHYHPPILLKIFFPLATFIILVSGDFRPTWCYLYQVAYPVLCEIRRKRVRATRGEITEEQREVKTRLEREQREEGREWWVMKWKEKGVKGGTVGA